MDTLKNEIRKLIVDSLELEDIAPDDIAGDLPLFGDEGLGLDSIDALELGVALRKKYALSLESGEAGNREHFASVDRLAKFISERRP